MNRHDEGSSAVEYGLIAVAIAALIMAVVFIVGQWSERNYHGACEDLAGEMSGGATTTCTSP